MAPQHFKQRHTLNFLPDYEKTFGFPLSWIFMGPGHGKCCCDSAGAFLKRMADKARNTEFRETGFQDSHALYVYFMDHLQDNPKYNSQKRFSPSKRNFFFVELGINRLLRNVAEPAPGTQSRFDVHSTAVPHKILWRRLSCTCKQCLAGAFNKCKVGEPLDSCVIPVPLHSHRQKLFMDKCNRGASIAVESGVHQLVAVHTSDVTPFYDVCRVELWDSLKDRSHFVYSRCSFDLPRVWSSVSCR